MNTPQTPVVVNPPTNWLDVLINYSISITFILMTWMILSYFRRLYNLNRRDPS